MIINLSVYFTSKVCSSAQLTKHIQAKKPLTTQSTHRKDIWQCTLFTSVLWVDCVKWQVVSAFFLFACFCQVSWKHTLRYPSSWSYSCKGNH